MTCHLLNTPFPLLPLLPPSSTGKKENGTINNGVNSGGLASAGIGGRWGKWRPREKTKRKRTKIFKANRLHRPGGYQVATLLPA